MAADPYRYFRVEAAEILEELGKGALRLEHESSPANVAPNLLRLAHTLKGAARVVKHIRIAELAHQVEDALVPLRERTGPVEHERITNVLQLLDTMGAELRSLAGAPGEAGAERTPSEDALRTVRADLAELDVLVEGVSEAQAHLGAFRAALRVVERARRAGERLAGAIDPTPGLALAGELDAALTAIEREGQGATDRLERELRASLESAERLRLVPASALFASLERAVRDAGESTGRRARFHASGEDLRLDAHVLGVVGPALVQLVRNGVAHGIESESERVAARKPVEGNVELTVARRANRASFTCRDDGRGIDVEAVRRVARDRGLGAADAHRLGAEELLQLMMTSGLSTSRTLTQVAGRGVGLDVVRDAAARLGGAVQVRTEPGRGTTFEISVPISVASVEALLVEVGPIQAAIPLDNVRRSLRVEPRHVARVADGATIVHDGEAIPLAPLASVLGQRPAPRPAARGPLASTAIVIEARDGLAALSVDRILGTDRVVVSSLSPLLRAGAVVAAASLDAEGGPRLVLDPDALVSSARRTREVARPAAATAPLPLLVVDDSLTTRMLEQSILESAGYEVDVASSGEEGLEKARKRRYGLFLVDVEMPGMDGFTFVRAARVQARSETTPAILVTSRDTPEDRQRGAEAGARAYVVKGEFDQVELLATIRRLLEER